MSIKEFFKPYVAFEPEQRQRMVNAMQPFASISELLGRRHEARANARRLGDGDKLLLLLFVLMSLILIATAIFAPDFTYSAIYCVMEAVQFALMVYIVLHFSRRRG